MKWLLGIFPLLTTLAACSGDGEVHTATMTGEVTYLERIALPPDAQVHVTLRGDTQPDMSSEGPAKLLARYNSTARASVPLPFTLRYDPGATDPWRPMVIEAWINVGEQVLFATTETMHVPVGSAAPVRLTLRRPRHVALVCADGSRPTAAFPLMGELAFIELNGGTAPVALRARPVASGFHYSGDGYSLGGRGKEAMLRRPRGGETRCEAQPPSPSPTIRP